MSDQMPSVPTIDQVEFVDEIPARAHPFGESKWVPYLDQVKKATTARVQAGYEVKPAIIARYEDPKQAITEAASLRAASKSRGNFSVTTRGGVIYVEFNGPFPSETNSSL